MGRDEPLQGFLLAEEQETQHTNRPYLVIGLHGTEGLGQLYIRQVQKAFVTLAAAFPDETPEALKLQGVQIAPGSPLNR